MLQNTIAAARLNGARLIFSGNVYNFGPDAGSVVSETSPQHLLTRKGAIRVEMEVMLEVAADDGVRSLVGRAGDFFGPHQPSSSFKDAMVKPGRPLRSVIYPGEPEAGHAWAYLPDLAETVARRDRDVTAGVPQRAFWRLLGRLPTRPPAAQGSVAVPIRGA